MSQVICPECARAESLLPTLDDSFTGTEYQLERYIKHSVPNSSEPYLTVFKAPSTAAYSGYIVAAAASGYVEIDDWNRQNLVVFASATTGFAFASGRFEGITNGVKVVVAHNPARVHGHFVLVERNAGFGSGYLDEDYIKAGAEIVEQAKEVFARADMTRKSTESTMQSWFRSASQMLPMPSPSESRWPVLPI